MSQADLHAAASAAEPRGAVLRRSLVIGVIAFLTLVDLFGAQALLPSLVAAYGVSPAEMGVAVNASTIGMAVAGLGVAFFARRIDRRIGVWSSLALLSVPTLLLAFCEDLTTFTILRILQGVFMSAAFTLSLTYLSEVCSVTAARGAMAAYITGNVASNFFGRLFASGFAANVGLSETFIFFAVLNLSGAALAYWYFSGWPKGGPGEDEPISSVGAALRGHLADPRLRASFLIGFVILFAFIGVFTYVNFLLSEPPFDLPQSYIGLVYAVFLPAVLTTPLAGGVAARFGVRAAFWGAMALSLAGVLALLSTQLIIVLAGLTAIGVGLFFAQAAITGYVGRTAQADHALANGLYLTSYYLGGLGGAWLIGQVFVAAGWTAAVGVIAAATAAAILLGALLVEADRAAG